MVRVSICLVALVLSQAACSPLISFTPNGPAKQAKSPDCQYELVSGEAPRPYRVIGVIDVEAFSTRKLPNDEASFRQALGQAVCKAGGDAVLPGINGDGRYVLATVVAWVLETTPQSSTTSKAGL